MKKRQLLSLAQRYVAIGTMGLAFSSLCSAQMITRISAPGLNAFAYDVNESGMVVGYQHNPIDGFARAVAWDASNAEIPLGGNFIASAALAVNDNGVAAGYGLDASHNSLPVKWVNGQPVELEHLGNGGQVNDINNLGEATGYVIAVGEGGYFAAKWTASGSLILLQENGVQAPIYSEGLSINDSGLLGVNLNSIQYPYVGQLLQGSQIIPRFADGAHLLGVKAINNLGGSAGFSYFNSLYDGNAAFQWSPEGVATRLNSVGTQPSARAICINDGGVVGGYSLNGKNVDTYKTLGTFWINGVAFAVDQPEGASVTVQGINDSGIAVGMVQTMTEMFAAKWSVPNPNAPNPINLRPATTAMPGQVVQIVAVVTNLNPVSGRRVEFRFNDISLGFQNTDATGIASMSYTVPLTSGAGDHSVMASLGGSSYKIQTQPIVKAPTSIRTLVSYPTGTRNVCIDAALSNTAVNKNLSGQKLIFSIGGRDYSTTTNSTGWAKIIVPITRDSRAGLKYSVRFDGNAGHLKSKIVK
jgi:hypothetical protein